MKSFSGYIHFESAPYEKEEVELITLENLIAIEFLHPEGRVEQLPVHLACLNKSIFFFSPSYLLLMKLFIHFP